MNLISQFNLQSLSELHENEHFIQFYFEKFESSLLKRLEFIGFYDIIQSNETEKHILFSKYSIAANKLPQAVNIPQKKHYARPSREMNNGIYLPLKQQINIVQVYRGFKPFPKMGHGSQEIWERKENQYELLSSKTTWRS